MKNNKSTAKALLYILIAVLFVSSVSLLQLMDVSMADYYYYFAVLLVLGIGIMHVIVTNKFLYPASEDYMIPGLWLSVLIMFFSILIIAIIYYYEGLNIQFITFIFAFIIPYLSFRSYRYFFQIYQDPEE